MLVGREDELEAVGALLADDSPAALVLEGEPGIGKTTLWEHGTALARERGFRVLTARASGAETEMPFAALIDLLDGVTGAQLATVPRPQLHALNVALYREEPNGPAPEDQAIALGLLSALRRLADDARVLLAVDDVQWLDRASEEALAYAVRRLTGEPVTVLLARRPGPRSLLEETFADGQLARLRVEPTSLGATRQILATRLSLRLPHHVVRRVYDTTLGNPLFTLEVGRVLARQDLDTLGDEVPVPDHVEELLGLRVTDLEAPVRRTVLALALDADLRVGQLRDLAGPGVLEKAVAEGVVVIEGDRVRASHPLVAAAAKNHASDQTKQELHRALADVVTNDEARALHLALATTVEDDELAAVVAAAAERAAARGAARRAVELAEHALRLTPPTSEAGPWRVLDLGYRLGVAGEKQRLTDLIEPRLNDLPHGAPRVRAYLLLTKGVVADNDEIRSLQERALEEAGDDPRLRAPVLAESAENEAAVTVARIARARDRAEEAAAAVDGRPEDKRLALAALAWTRALSGQPISDLAERYRALSDDRYLLSRYPARVDGQRLVWRGQVAEARELLTSLKVQSEERGEPSSYALVRLHLCELELRVGGWSAAQHLLDDWADSTDSHLLHWPMYERCRALLAAGRGDVDDARHWARTALDRAEKLGVRWDWLETRRALGLVALLGKDVEEATGHFAAVWDHTEAEGVTEPGVFPVAPDLVEALVESAAVDEALRVTERLAGLADSLDHPWARTGLARSRALVQLAVDYTDEAAAALEAAAASYGRLGLAFDEARTTLVLGRAQRRARKWGAARETLERAAKAFDAIGSAGWATDARADLDRVGARKPTSTGHLTPTEGRVARLAAEGLSNKEIARRLVVTVNTVEFHLRNAYAKLEIRSRVQLAAALGDEAADSGQPDPE